MNAKAKKSLRRRRLPKLPRLTLEYQLCEVLMQYCGERGDNEGAVDTLCRIVHERDQAMEALALDRMKRVSIFG